MIPTLIVNASLCKLSGHFCSMTSSCMHISMASLFDAEMGSHDEYSLASLVIRPTILKSKIFISISVSDLNYVIMQDPARMYQVSWRMSVSSLPDQEGRCSQDGNKTRPEEEEDKSTDR